MSAFKVLVIDDDESIRNMLKLILGFEGYEVVTASNGEEGLELMRKSTPPAIILLDLMMPVMNGLEFIEKFSSEFSSLKIPIVVLTAAANRDDEIQGHLVLEKPINMEYLLSIISDHNRKSA